MKHFKERAVACDGVEGLPPALPLRGAAFLQHRATGPFDPRRLELNNG